MERDLFEELLSISTGRTYGIICNTICSWNIHTEWKKHVLKDDAKLMNKSFQMRIGFLSFVKLNILIAESFRPNQIGRLGVHAQTSFVKLARPRWQKCRIYIYWLHSSWNKMVGHRGRQFQLYFHGGNISTRVVLLNVYDEAWKYLCNVYNFWTLRKRR